MTERSVNVKAQLSARPVEMRPTGRKPTGQESPWTSRGSATKALLEQHGLSDPDREKSQRVMAAMLQMGKLEVAGLEAAAEG